MMASKEEVVVVERSHSPCGELSNIKLDDLYPLAGDEQRPIITESWSNIMDELTAMREKNPTTYADILKGMPSSLFEQETAAEKNNSATIKENKNKNNNNDDDEKVKGGENYIVIRYNISKVSDIDSIGKRGKEISVTLSGGKTITCYKIIKNKNNNDDDKVLICKEHDFESSSSSSSDFIPAIFLSAKMPVSNEEPRRQQQQQQEQEQEQRRRRRRHSSSSSRSQQQHHHHYYCPMHNYNNGQQRQQQQPVSPLITKSIVGDKSKFCFLVGRRRSNVLKIEENFNVKILVPGQYDLSNNIIVQGYNNEDVKGAVEEIENQLKYKFY